MGSIARNSQYLSLYSSTTYGLLLGAATAAAIRLPFISPPPHSVNNQSREGGSSIRDSFVFKLLVSSAAGGAIGVTATAVGTLFINYGLLGKTLI